MEQKLYIGIDLHKRSQTWVVLGEKDNTKLLTKTYLVTPEAIDEAFNQTKKFGNHLVAFIEPVCGWIWVVEQLKSLGIEVHISNPRKIRMIADSLKKTDEEDAYILAKLLKTGNAYESYECDPKTRLESIVTRDGNHAFSPSLKNRTKISLANDEVKIHLKAIQAMDSIIKRVEKQIADNMEYKKEEIERLLTIPGIGRISANIIVSEIGDFERFKKPQHLASFARLVPRERSSGGKQKLGSITHAGSPYLRYVLIESAMRIRDTKETQSLYSFYKNIKSRSGAMKARVALARKLSTIIWFIMKNKQDYVTY